MRPHAQPIVSARSRDRHISRRGVLARGAALAAGLAGGRALAASKVPKSQAGYKDQAPGDRRCDRCAQFQPPSGCKIVDGAVSPQGSCNFFAPKS